MIALKKNILPFILIAINEICASFKMNDDSELNLNDVLRMDLMPTYFLQDSNGHSFNNTINRNTAYSTNGSIEAALSTLSFHR